MHTIAKNIIKKNIIKNLRIPLSLRRHSQEHANMDKESEADVICECLEVPI